MLSVQDVNQDPFRFSNWSPEFGERHTSVMCRANKSLQAQPQLSFLLSHLRFAVPLWLWAFTGPQRNPSFLVLLWPPVKEAREGELRSQQLHTLAMVLRPCSGLDASAGPGHLTGHCQVVTEVTGLWCGLCPSWYTSP